MWKPGDLGLKNSEVSLGLKETVEKGIVRPIPSITGEGIMVRFVVSIYVAHDRVHILTPRQKYEKIDGIMDNLSDESRTEIKKKIGANYKFCDKSLIY